MSMPLVIKQKEVSSPEGCNLENIGQENRETWDPNSSWWISRGGASFSVGVYMGMSYGPALPIPSLLLPGAEKRAGIPSLQSPTCELRQHPSFPCFSDEYTHFTTNRIPAAHQPPPSRPHPHSKLYPQDPWSHKVNPPFKILPSILFIVFTTVNLTPIFI